MERPPESLKTFANRVANATVSPDGAKVTSLLRRAGFLGAAGEDSRARHMANVMHVDSVVNSDHIGIWERKVENGKTCFVRRLDMMHDWQQWANVGRIEAKGDKPRVVLIGESVARGYLYDPLFSSSIALQMILDARFGKGEVEVIDLARSNLSFEVRELALSALQLEPDIVIIYAGNNWWSASFPLPGEIADVDDGLPTTGISEIRRLTEAQISRNATEVVRDIASEYQRRGMPLVWIIPEYNLADWRDASTNPPHLTADLNREWIELRHEAESALRDGDIGRAEELATRMVEIDEGICVTGFYLLAECRERSGDLEGARKHLESARDALIWDTLRAVAPRPYSVNQKMLREELPRYNCQVIDVPALFKEYLEGELPSRRLFIDYCHLTTEGVQVVMGAAASCVLRVLKGIDVPWRSLTGAHIAPPPEVEAEARFLAAIHNAHWYQRFDVVLHHCKHALACSPHVADVMLAYVELQTRNHTPMLMSEADERIQSLSSPLIHHYLFRSNGKLLDRVLLGAMVEALAEVKIDAGELLDRLRREEHSVTRGPVNLLDYYYCASGRQPHETSWMIELGIVKKYPQYYKAYETESRFIFVGEAGYAVQFSLTCRLPQSARGEDTVSFEVNGRFQGQMTIAPNWTTWDIAVDGETLRDGLNEVVVRWPMPEFEGETALERIVANICENKFPDFFPIFGEIHSFTACDARSVQGRTVVAEPELAFEI
ncbi:MAG TPA: hypothetical protein VJT15_07345 [Pyrinomonadaceae bacterium]|nr:hypothetical protein [Pyrinomonadaceae bacterium]